MSVFFTFILGTEGDFDQWLVSREVYASLNFIR